MTPIELKSRRDDIISHMYQVQTLLAIIQQGTSSDITHMEQSRDEAEADNDEDATEAINETLNILQENWNVLKKASKAMDDVVRHINHIELI